MTPATDKNQKTPFDQDVFMTILGHLTGLSRDHLDSGTKEEITRFGTEAQTKKKTDLEVWNFFKYLLDVFVHNGASSFVMSVVDLERFYEAPTGGYKQSDNSIRCAPWRQEENRL